MARFLIWMDEGDIKGWRCSNCDWMFPLPTLLEDDEARKAYDRLGAAKFKEHVCESSARQQAAASSKAPSFAERARALVMRGYKPRMPWPLFLMRLLSNRVTTRRLWRKLKQSAITSCSRSEKGVSDRQTPGFDPKLRSEVKVKVGAGEQPTQET
jgi:hypothetical protein